MNRHQLTIQYSTATALIGNAEHTTLAPMSSTSICFWKILWRPIPRVKIWRQSFNSGVNVHMFSGHFFFLFLERRLQQEAGNGHERAPLEMDVCERRGNICPEQTERNKFRCCQETDDSPSFSPSTQLRPHFQHVRFHFPFLFKKEKRAKSSFYRFFFSSDARDN